MKRYPLIELPIVVMLSAFIFHFIIFPFLTAADTESNIFAVFIFVSWSVIAVFYGMSLMGYNEIEPKKKKTKTKIK